MLTDFKENYSPLFFLTALGNGGLTVAFFIFFMFMTPHQDAPMATFDSLQSYLATAPLYATLLTIIGYIFMLYFAFNHIRLLLWNIREYRLYKKTKAYAELLRGNNEITLMAIPLTLTMSINVFFVLGAMLIPGLWGIVEMLFPFAFLAFLATGIYSLIIFFKYYSKLLIQGHFQHALNNSLSQMLSSFAFAMNAVGFAAPAAMSENHIIVPTAAFCAIFFFAIAVLLAMKNIALGFYAMLEHGINRESSASIWILIPILTLLGITTIRLHHGFGFLMQDPGRPAFLFIFCSTVVSLQIFIGILGYLVLKQSNYFHEFIHGRKDNGEAAKSPAAYALICPGVAFWVFGMFFLDKALVQTGLLTLFSLPYFILLAPLLYVLLQTIRVNWKLNRRMLYQQ